jgi:hypothetical protein
MYCENKLKWLHSLLVCFTTAKFRSVGLVNPLWF